MTTTALLDLATISIDDILTLPLSHGEQLLGSDEPLRTQRFRQLALRFHPDRNRHPQAADALQKLITLRGYNGANGTTSLFQTLTIHTTTNDTYRLRYIKQHATPTGSVWIGQHHLAYLISNDAVTATGINPAHRPKLEFADDAMRQGYQYAFVQPKNMLTAAEGTYVILSKLPDEVLLTDYIDYYKSKVDAKQVAWIVNRLISIACYLTWAKLAHNAIEPGNILINPGKHTLTLAGGWELSTALGQRPKALTQRGHMLMDPALVSSKTSDPLLDLKAALAIGREMLGDFSGSNLHPTPDVPAALVNFMKQGVRGTDVFKIYEQYQTKTLTDSFGKRTFVNDGVTFQKIYEGGRT